MLRAKVYPTPQDARGGTNQVGETTYLHTKADAKAFKTMVENMSGGHLITVKYFQNDEVTPLKTIEAMKLLLELP